MLENDVTVAMREGLRRLAKAVVVITTTHAGQRYAMAATAVSELSMEPPALLICVNRTASLHPPLADGAAFCVNILHASQTHILKAVTGSAKGEARFGLGDWRDTSLAVPRLDDSQASFVCINDQRTDYGTHSIFIGKVVETFTHGTVDPLIYVDGGYVRSGANVDL